MQRIQSIADIQQLQQKQQFPNPYLEILYQQFKQWFEATSEYDDLLTFQLPTYACIYHLDNEEDTGFLMDQIIHVEYVETDKVDGMKYFRIGLMQDNHMSLIFFPEGTLAPKIEKWLES